MKKILKNIIKILIIFIVSLFILVLVINFFVILTTKKQVISLEKASNLEDVSAIVVLGAAVWGNNPSPMLEERLKESIKLYEHNPNLKIIMSGDHGTKYYDEVNIMKSYAIDNGVPSENIFMDHAGFSTYESLYRAKEVFNVKKVIIVTQKYHLYRALYIAKSLGIEAYGLASDSRMYSGQIKRELREVLARDKDFIKCLFKLNPTYLGESIPVSGNGDITNDK